jgi:putative FmdB family regulatory protein
MPLYTYRCDNCEGFTFDLYAKISEMSQWYACPECNEPAHKIIVPPMVAPDWAPYECPITGKEVWGRRAHAENLKRHGCRVYEAGETQEFIKRRADRDREADRQVEKLVERTAREVFGGIQM